MRHRGHPHRERRIPPRSSPGEPPYAGVSTAILLFTKTNSGGTDHVWFYDVDADGMSLDDKRTELLPPEKLGPVPSDPATREPIALTADGDAKNNLPDVLARWRSVTQASSLSVHRASSPKTARTDRMSAGQTDRMPVLPELIAAEDGAEYRTVSSPARAPRTHRTTSHPKSAPAGATDATSFQRPAGARSVWRGDPVAHATG